MSAGRRNDVAPVVNRLYRRLVIGRSAIVLWREAVCGLPIRDTADCQSALPWKGVQK